MLQRQLMSCRIGAAQWQENRRTDFYAVWSVVGCQSQVIEFLDRILQSFLFPHSNRKHPGRGGISIFKPSYHNTKTYIGVSSKLHCRFQTNCARFFVGGPKQEKNSRWRTDAILKLPFFTQLFKLVQQNLVGCSVSLWTQLPHENVFLIHDSGRPLLRNLKYQKRHFSTTTTIQAIA